ncbi:MAG: methylenetetrahydrofolate reductase [NAD(P)H] [Gammaproteobacteria bacterium]|nr:methylenetetrahydrofolate reductase [NAD(P)H] [Gammaproteobacteria bacterium]
MKKLPTISFEFFPPKTPEGIKTLQQTAKELSQFNPDFFSVTFGAGGSTREGTLEVVAWLQKNISVSVAPHLACIGLTRTELTQIIQKYEALGIKRLVVLRGDLPSGMGHSGELRYASDLVALIRDITDDHFHIEVAAYPEVHPQAKTAFDDLANFKRKVTAGATSAITQYFFNPDAYFYFLDECAKQSIHIPIVPGIMPITHFDKLMRFSDMCGAEIPRWIRKRLEIYGDDIASLQEFGSEIVYNLCETLIKGGAPGLHFYTLNQARASVKLIKLLTESALRSS